MLSILYNTTFGVENHNHVQIVELMTSRCAPLALLLGRLRVRSYVVCFLHQKIDRNTSCFEESLKRGRISFGVNRHNSTVCEWSHSHDTVKQRPQNAPVWMDSD
jgi:hypothetical protein